MIRFSPKTPGRALQLLLFLAVSLFPGMLAAQAIIIDHTCTDLSKIPAAWLSKAKELTLHYAHTSHGSQIISGIQNLETLHATYSVAVREDVTEGLPPAETPAALRIYDGNPGDTYVTPDRYWDGDDGKNLTRSVADTGHYDFSMWSWCGQVTDSDDAYIQQYLAAMHQFETEYPAMRFIFMTGHLDGTGAAGDLHRRNNIIRNYCKANDKVLFDFADIERYNPDGTDFLDRGADDECDYDNDSRNWADEWCAAHPGSELCDPCTDCAHSRDINCNLKARAFWWMMARLAGWPGPSETATVDFTATPRSGDPPLTVQFTDLSTGSITSRSWNFGDGQKSPLKNPSHMYSLPGRYTVSLTIQSTSGGLTETKHGYIRVGQPQSVIGPFHLLIGSDAKK